MKRSRRVVLTMMGTAAVGAASMGFVPSRGLRSGRAWWPARMDDPIAARSTAASAARRIISMRMARAATDMATAADYQFMQRLACTERDDWRLTAEACGFDFHTIDGERYWDERAHYAFTLQEIELGIEAPTAEIDAMCLALVARAVGDENYLRRLKIPETFWPLIRTAGTATRAASTAGSTCFDGQGPAKLLEYNADTPTSIFEAAVFQWGWLEQSIERRIVPMTPTSSTRSTSD